MTDTSEKLKSIIRDYGAFDPLAETQYFINPCLCGQPLSSTHVIRGIPLPEQLGLDPESSVTAHRVYVECPKCKAKGPATKTAVAAILQWNISLLCIKPSYTEIPLFGIAGLAPIEATVKVQCIRADLKARLEECDLRLQDPDASKHPGPRYHAKLSAYYTWTFYALHLLSSNVFKSNTHGVKGVSGEAN